MFVRLSSYRRPVWGAVLLLFILANSGFTLASHLCATQTHACCAAAPRAHRHAAASHADNLSLSRPSAACCTLTVAGGVNTNPIVSERTASNDLQRLAQAAAALQASVDFLIRTPCSSPVVFTDSLPAPAAPADLYLLNATLLI